MRKHSLTVNLFFSVSITALLVFVAQEACFAKQKEKEQKPALCTPVGELQCPKGYKANCPKQYRPSCVFLGTKQLPACLADNADGTFYKYNLDNITCEKK